MYRAEQCPLMERSLRQFQKVGGFQQLIYLLTKISAQPEYFLIAPVLVEIQTSEGLQVEPRDHPLDQS